MDHTILCDIEEFEAKALWPESKGAIPKPSLRALQVAQTAVRGLFYAADYPQKRLNPSEDNIAKVMVHDIINRIELPRTHKAALSQNENDFGYASKSKVDAALYLRENLPTDGRPNWTHLRAFIEFKRGGTSLDPWDDEKDQSESWAESRAEVRGRLIWYAYMSFLYQHRTDLYSLFINGTQFRAIRWDRSGLIVSKATDYAEDPSRLLRFLWAFASLNDAEQGLDPSATLLSSIMPEWKMMNSCSEPNDALDMPFMDRDDVSRFFAQPAPAPKGPAARTRRQETKRSAKPVFKFVRDQFRKSLDPGSGWPRYKLQVGETKQEFLVGKPVFQSTSVFGRGTKGYIALDCATGSFVFLKDSWRPFYEGVEREGDYLTAMASDGSIEMVIPTVVEHGDVLTQTTFSANFNSEDPAAEDSPEEQPSASSGNASFSSRSAAPVTMLGKKRPYEEDAAPDEGQPRMASPPDALIHYRIAVEEVCLTLDAFQYGLQLVKIIEDCIITHRDAYEHFGLLHRDVSVGNILILPRILDIDGRKEVLWHGLLTDWELAKYVPKDGSDPQRGRQPERTGTWQFMSVAYVRNPERPVIIADELESFFHVLLYQSVRYLRSSLGAWVTSFITHYFDAFQQNGTGTQICHPYKVAAVETGEVKHSSSGVVIFNNLNGPSPMNGLFQEWLALFQARYAELKLEPKPSIPADEQPEDLLIGIVRGRNWALKRAQSEPQPPKEPNATASSEAQAFLKTMKQAEDQLNNHAATLNIFSKFRGGTDESDATAPRWSMQDKLGDQLSSSYDPRYQVINLRRSAVSAMASNQRASASKKVKVDPNSRPSNASAARPLPMDAPQPPDPSVATTQPGPSDTRRVTRNSSKVTLRGRDLPVPKRRTRARK